jgi:hypothetical protein
MKLKATEKKNYEEVLLNFNSYEVPFLEIVYGM